MSTSQTVLAKNSPASAFAMPAFVVVVLAVLWLTPLLWGSYEQFLDQARRARSWVVVAPMLTVAVVVMWGMVTFQRLRHAGVIVAMDDETFTVIAFRERTFRLKDLEKAELSENGRLFSIHLRDGSSRHYGAGFWDRSPGDVAAILTDAAAKARGQGL